MPAWAEAIHPEDREGAARRLAAPAVGDGTEYHVEYRLRGGDGAYRWFLGHALPAARRIGPGGRLVRHLHRHRLAMAGPRGDRAAQPRPARAGRRAGDPPRDDPDRHRAERGQRVRPDPGQPGAGAAAGDCARLERLADRAGGSAARALPLPPRRAGNRPGRPADAGRGPRGTPGHRRGPGDRLRRRPHPDDLRQRRAAVRRGRPAPRRHRRVHGRDRMAAGRGGAGRQRGAAPPGRPGDRAGPLRPGPGQRDPAMVGAHQGHLRAPGRLPDHLRALPRPAPPGRPRSGSRHHRTRPGPRGRRRL